MKARTLAIIVLLTSATPAGDGYIAGGAHPPPPVIRFINHNTTGRHARLYFNSDFHRLFTRAFRPGETAQ